MLQGTGADRHIRAQCGRSGKRARSDRLGWSPRDGGCPGAGRAGPGQNAGAPLRRARWSASTDGPPSLNTENMRRHPGFVSLRW